MILASRARPDEFHRRIRKSLRDFPAFSRRKIQLHFVGVSRSQFNPGKFRSLALFYDLRQIPAFAPVVSDESKADAGFFSGMKLGSSRERETSGGDLKKGTTFHHKEMEVRRTKRKSFDWRDPVFQSKAFASVMKQGQVADPPGLS